MAISIKYLKNKVVFYLVSRYLTYFIQFISSLIIAAELGPYYMGIWSVILLLLNYFQQIHFGIANSFNILYVQNRNNKEECDNLIGNSILLLSYLSGFVVLFFVYYQLFGIGFLEKYNIDKYLVWVCLIAVMQYFVNFFLNLFRVKNQLNRVAFCQSVVVVVNFVFIFLFHGEELIKWLVVGYLIGNFSCVMMALISNSIPNYKKINFSRHTQFVIIKKGLYLFLYNSCFYFIVIFIRTIISGNYSVEEFGLFSFSYTLANALMLIFEALMFVVFPKLIGKLSSEEGLHLVNTITSLRISYITSAHFLIYLAMICFPFIILFIPQYENSLTSLNLISLTILININSTGYIDLLISRNKEKIAALLSASALFLNALLSLFVVKILHTSFSYVVVSTLVTYLFYTMAIVYFSRKMIKMPSIGSFFELYFPVRLLIPYIVAFILSLCGVERLMIIPLILFVVLNFSIFRQIIDSIKTLLFKPEVINLV